MTTVKDTQYTAMHHTGAVRGGASLVLKCAVPGRTMGIIIHPGFIIHRLSTRSVAGVREDSMAAVFMAVEEVTADLTLSPTQSNA